MIRPGIELKSLRALANTNYYAKSPSVIKVLESCIILLRSCFVERILWRILSGANIYSSVYGCFGSCLYVSVLVNFALGYIIPN